MLYNQGKGCLRSHLLGGVALVLGAGRERRRLRSIPLEQVQSHDDVLDLRRPFIDLRDARVSVIPFRGMSLT